MKHSGGWHTPVRTQKELGAPYRGSHQFRDSKGNRHGLFLVFWSDVIVGKEGWYWMSESYNNGLVIGPFDTSRMAYNDAVDQEQ